MKKGRRKIAVFGSCFSGRYRKELARCFNIAAEELNVDLHYFNSLGKIGTFNALYIDYEADLFDYIDLSQYDGVVFDGDGYSVDGVAERVIRKLRNSGRAVVSVSTHIDGFYNVVYEDTAGLRGIIEHFLDHHKFTRIGFMSGYLTHPDAQARLAEFRRVMRERGFPEDGAGMFEGDFWFNKGDEAADFFLSLPERPEAIVCANDYMAIALSNALKKRGLNIPRDIAISGFDGTIEGQEYFPHLTSVPRERLQLARKSLKLLLDVADNIQPDAKALHIVPTPEFTQSCGCAPLDYHQEADNINQVYNMFNSFIASIYDSEGSMLRLNKVENVQMIESVFNNNSFNFGDYTAFFMMLHTDGKGSISCESDFTTPSGSFTPVVWTDRNKEYTSSRRVFDSSCLVPESSSDKSHFYYIMGLNWSGRIFGYTAIEMSGKEIFNEFYIMWLLNLSMTLDALYKADHIKKLIGKLENLSIKDDLTGMLNRRGFENRSRDILTSVRGKKNICTMVIDVDGLKHINDEYGHYEGDRVIKAAADIISACCDSGEIAGRAGGDEFYIFAADYSQKQLERFIGRLTKGIAGYNEVSSCPYRLDMSWGAFITETDCRGRLEDFLKVSDSRMYEQKMLKPGRRH